MEAASARGVSARLSRQLPRVSSSGVDGCKVCSSPFLIKSLVYVGVSG
jgi:hypothetical protein